uniref:centrosomal protein of 72 kDa n=1 Tax=Euleptes europaea TaxID=460621 RepID=UPI002540E45A|nr:centrosomal protein of 72 kDa [Euleptes europaea]
MEAGRAPLTEEDIRERVSLRPEDLAHVRVLSLPGTYHEKITHLGSSLKNFIHLKSLDLSRNALISLEGLQHLTSLEKLNLYFNRISSLSEVFRLQTLTALQEVDLRLNPVIKNESDYRPFVVHMLPNLRQLDDCPVRDRERKASLLHFTPEQAYEFQKPPEAPEEPQTESTSIHKRAEYVYSLSKKCSVMDEDDEAVLNLIAKCEHVLSKPPGVTGSTKRDPEVQFHISNIFSSQEGRHLPDSPVSPVAVNRKKSVNVAFLDSSHLQNTLPGEGASLEHLLDLVDKYWNGCRSLHCNEEFLTQAGMVLSAIQKGEDDRPPSHFEDQALPNLLLEDKLLPELLFEREEQHSIQIKSLKAELSSKKKDLDILKEHLHQVLEENEILKACQAEVTKNAQSADAANAQRLQITKLQNQNQLLTKENASLKQRLQHFDKLQELTQMLQESHKTLISTNECLLRELEEARSRHEVEVEELHWSYNQLKMTMKQLPSAKADSSKS